MKKLTVEEKIMAEQTLKEVEADMKNSSDRTELTRISDGYPALIDDLKKISKAKRLPEQVIFHYGCYGCEWKGTDDCPFKFKVGKGHSAVKNRHSAGICDLRKFWLMSLYQGDKERPTYRMWLRDFHKHMGYSSVKKAETRLKIIDAKLIELNEQGVETDEIERYDAARVQAHNDWLNIWKEIRKHDEAAEEREVTRKIKMDITHSERLSLGDIQRMMRIKPKKVIEVDEDGKIQDEVKK